MGRKKDQSFLEQTAELFDLPADAVAGTPRVDLMGDQRVFVEGHGGILSYSQEEVNVSGGRLIFRIRGEGLTLKTMTRESLCISGKIASVELI